ncbi:ATP-binding cassette domain-containing protein [Coriobacteriaceae bacterium]|uniref:ATP-binding cassette domain-containing protein n=1 Tax=Coriobacteriia TaxID=84998 RepID=UPI0010948491|nr:ATP-binding cassette domain-containing protein [Atopobiaceae bacterium FL090493]TGY60329.1 ATP-binding cassette domain-containing protein [Coriobacteriaceae bacterium]
MLEVSNLAAGYGWSPVFRNISFRLRRGEVVGLAAPNGVGKTTLMRALAGDVPVGKGSVVEADGQKRLPGRSRRWPVYYSGWQQVTQRCPLSAFELMGHAAGCWGSDACTEAIGDRLGVLSFWKRPLRSYSQGMIQQTLLAMASATEAPYTLLDEPMNALDPLRTKQAELEVRAMARAGRTVLISSHLLEGLQRICDRVLFLHCDAVEEVKGNVDLREGFFSCYETSRE